MTAVTSCSTDDEAKSVGVDWCVRQAEELYSRGVKSIHFYSHNAVPSVRRVLQKLHNDEI